MSKVEDLLDKALDFIVETQKENDYICEQMCEEYVGDYCANNCQNLNEECVKLFLEKVYKKMSKTEEFAYSKYPRSKKGVLYDLARNSIIQGYHQAEKDLELGWEVLALIRLAFDATEANINLGSLKISPMTKEYYEEVLKRFKSYGKKEI